MKCHVVSCLVFLQNSSVCVWYSMWIWGVCVCCIWGVCVCVYVLYMGVCVCARLCICQVQRMIFGILCYHFLSYCLEIGSSLLSSLLTI